MAPMPIRPFSNVRIACPYPSPGRPIRFASGTSQSSKTTSAVSLLRAHLDGRGNQPFNGCPAPVPRRGYSRFPPDRIQGRGQVAQGAEDHEERERGENAERGRTAGGPRGGRERG